MKGAALQSTELTGRLQVAFQKAAVVLGVSGVGPRSTSPNRAPWSPLGRLRLSCVGVPSPSAPEGAPGGGPFRSAIAERHVRISIRVAGVSPMRCPIAA